MTTFQAIILALVQGISEFLPISSSAHLILVPIITGWPDQGLLFDIAMHLGTLFAVLGYFRQDLQYLWFGFYRLMLGKPSLIYSRLVWQLMLATIPIVIVGLLVHDQLVYLRHPLVIAGSTIGFGLLLGISDYFSQSKQTLVSLTWQKALLIGLAQICALIPGASRSGVTLSAGLAQGLSRQASARFAFLLSIPVISMAAGYESITLFKQPTIDWPNLLIGISVAALCAYACIKVFLAALPRIGVWPFVIYRLLLGLVLFYLFWP